MARLRIATWNINSVRAHMDVLARFVAEEAPDLLCLQETKVADEHFPLADLRRMGFAHQAIFGQKSYHGVAVFSAKLPLERIEKRRWCGIEDARHLHCRVAGIELHNFYVPAGGDVADVEANDKFRHKLQFMAEVTDWFRRRKRRANRIVLVGDLNVAPLESDVWNHKQLLRSVGHTPVESEHMAKVLKAGGMIDAVRHFVPPSEPRFCGWGFRVAPAVEKKKGGRRDHGIRLHRRIGQDSGLQVIKQTRSWEKPSDHVPVMVELG